ncbi:MAG: hypothetical protein IIY21_23835 [Clostridiales bacterium]|nr:hypothetical protein [Clostridiales bacterium]MBQ1571270.1 hypothetical protein [Clostridiales bacterium]
MIGLANQVAVDKVSGKEVKADDLIKAGFKPYKGANGKTYLALPNSCLFCWNCTDIFYDFTNGPYMFICREDGDTINGMCGKCKSFKGEEK